MCSADQDANAGAARARFLQALDFAHADVGGEFLAFGDGAFGAGRAAVPAPGSITRDGKYPRDSSRSSHGHAVDLDGRDADADRHALPFLAADADAFVELEIVAHHADVLQRFRTVADQRGVAHRPRDLAVLDQVAFGRGEDEIAAGDIHLAAAEVRAVEALRDGADDLFGSLSPASMKVLVMRGMGMCA